MQRTRVIGDTNNWMLRDYPGNHWVFGKPTLASSGNSKARWERGNTSPLDQKSPTGWVINLYGGVQNGSSWSRAEVPVNEIPVTSLEQSMWAYYMSATETMGVNMVVWVHDPTDYDKRAEITQLGGASGLEKAIGWNAHELDTTVTQFFFYGENTTGTGLTAGTQYTWDQFQADALFSTWTIYRITYEYGWEASGTFDDVYIAQISINGIDIPLVPDGRKHLKTVVVSKTLECEGGYSDEDVMSESDTGSAGTDWDFDFGGVGKITKAIAHHATTGMTFGMTLFLFTTPPTSELDDNAANTAPAAADVGNFVGTIVFPAMQDLGSGPSYSIVTPSLTTGNLPLEFDAPKLYGIAVITDAQDPGDDTLLTIILTAEMVD